MDKRILTCPECRKQIDINKALKGLTKLERQIEKSLAGDPATPPDAAKLNQGVRRHLDKLQAIQVTLRLEVISE